MQNKRKHYKRGIISYNKGANKGRQTLDGSEREPRAQAPLNLLRKRI